MLIMPINGYFLHNGPQSGQGLADSSESKVKHGTYNPATETNGQTTYYFQKKKPRAICSCAGRCRTPSWHRRQHPQRGECLCQRSGLPRQDRHRGFLVYLWGADYTP